MRRIFTVTATTVFCLGIILSFHNAVANDRSSLNFKGLHVGGQIGGVAGNLDVAIVDTLVLFPPGFSRSRDLDGIVGGVRVGYDVRWDKLVFGLLGNYDWSDVDGADTAQAPVAPHHNTTRSQIKRLATLTARLGYVISPRWLLYAEGGRVWAKTTQSGTTIVNATGAVPAAFEGEADRVGWVIGTGAEFSLDRNWSLDFGYKFIDFGSDVVPVVRTHLPAGVRDVNRQNEELELQVIKFGINYRF